MLKCRYAEGSCKGPWGSRSQLEQQPFSLNASVKKHTPHTHTPLNGKGFRGKFSAFIDDWCWLVGHRLGATPSMGSIFLSQLLRSAFVAFLALPSKLSRLCHPPLHRPGLIKRYSLGPRANKGTVCTRVKFSGTAPLVVETGVGTLYHQHQHAAACSNYNNRSFRLFFVVVAGRRVAAVGTSALPASRRSPSEHRWCAGSASVAV